MHLDYVDMLHINAIHISIYQLCRNIARKKAISSNIFDMSFLSKISLFKLIFHNSSEPQGTWITCRVYTVIPYTSVSTSIVEI